MYEIEVRHQGLGRYRLIRGKDRHVVRQRAAAQAQQWEQMWARRLAADERQRVRTARAAARAERAQQKEERRAEAQERSREAADAIAALERLLADSLSRHDAIDWDTLKDRALFPTPAPRPAPRPAAPSLPPLPLEPKPTDPAYQFKITLLDRLFTYRWHAKADAADARFRADHEAWQRAVAQHQRRAAEALREHEATLLEWEQSERTRRADWEAAKAEYEREQVERNAAVDRDREAYGRGEPEAVLDYCDLVLSRSPYPESFPRVFELDFVAAGGTLFVDYELPPPDAVPSVREVKYVVSRDEFQDVPLAERARNALYESVVYQVMLRCVHELYEADEIRALRCIVLNGHVRMIDPANGREARPCIAALRAEREAFLAVDLSKVDPEKCFRALGGRAATKLHAPDPVEPFALPPREPAQVIPQIAPAAAVRIDLSSLDD